MLSVAPALAGPAVEERGRFALRLPPADASSEVPRTSPALRGASRSPRHSPRMMRSRSSPASSRIIPTCSAAYQPIVVETCDLHMGTSLQYSARIGTGQPRRRRRALRQAPGRRRRLHRAEELNHKPEIGHSGLIELFCAGPILVSALGHDARLADRLFRLRRFSLLARLARRTRARPRVVEAGVKEAGLALAGPKPFVDIVCPIMQQQAEARGLPPMPFVRLIWKESRFNPQAVSPKGAQGIAQFMPATAEERGLERSVRAEVGDRPFGEPACRSSPRVRQFRAGRRRL